MTLPDLRESFRYKEPPQLRVLMLSIYYPFFLGKYFERALRRNPGIDLITTGVYTGTWIPWSDAEHPDGMNLPQKYANPPDIPLPFPTNVGRVSYDLVRARLPFDWTPDLVITSDAGINWTDKPKDGYVVTIGTDPHVLDYTHARSISDKFFCMQKCYMERGDVYLPYAYDPSTHYMDIGYEEWGVGAHVYEKDTDCVLIGMPYHQRVEWVDQLRARGASVIFENSPIFDEYRELANRARIGLNWSSMDDLNARFFEAPAFGLAMVTNRVPDAHLFLTEGIDYLGFDTLQEAIVKVSHLLKNPEEVERLSTSAYRKIQPHTYDNRIKQILEECGL